MPTYVKILLLLPFCAFCLQFFNFAMSQKAEQKQHQCLGFGITFTTIGIVSLVYRDVWLAVTGMVLIMLGLRLIAAGLDRLDKKIFIDRHEDD